MSKDFESHPLRVRGLKQCDTCGCGTSYEVAPPAGAWIETIRIRSHLPRYKVAPPAGAWIETCTNVIVWL